MCISACDDVTNKGADPGKNKRGEGRSQAIKGAEPGNKGEGPGNQVAYRLVQRRAILSCSSLFCRNCVAMLPTRGSPVQGRGVCCC